MSTAAAAAGTTFLPFGRTAQNSAAESCCIRSAQLLQKHQDEHRWLAYLEHIQVITGNTPGAHAHYTKYLYLGQPSPRTMYTSASSARSQQGHSPILQIYRTGADERIHSGTQQWGGWVHKAAVQLAVVGIRR